MIFEIALAILAGLVAGTITGLIPGIHVNLLGIILIALIGGLQNVPLIALAMFIVALAITHTFIDFIPSVFLGAPEEDTFLSILPGHQMLQEGNAHEAVVLTVYGSLIALGVTILCTPIFLYVIPIVFDATQIILPFILIFVSLYLVLREEKIVPSLIVFVMAGFLGFGAFNIPVNQPLLPLLTGLFGASALMISIKNNVKIEQQNTKSIKEIKVSKKEVGKATLASIISAPLCSFLPGVGAGHAAVIGSEFVGQSRRGFLLLLGAINTIVMGLSFITLYVIGRTRTGAAVAVDELLDQITLHETMLLLGGMIIAGGLASIVAINISKVCAKNIHKIEYNTLSYCILATLVGVVFFFSGITGILIFVTASALGIFTILSGVRRISLMGVLLIPTILFYLTV